MIIKTEKSWKTLLTPDDEKRLNDILEQIKKHRVAYLSADDVKLAQIWCAFVEAKKENAQLDARIKRLEYVLSGMIARAESVDSSASKLLESLKKF